MERSWIREGYKLKIENKLKYTKHFINEGIFSSYYILDSTPVTKLFPSFNLEHYNKET